MALEWVLFTDICDQGDLWRGMHLKLEAIAVSDWFLLLVLEAIYTFVHGW